MPFPVPIRAHWRNSYPVLIFYSNLLGLGRTYSDFSADAALPGIPALPYSPPHTPNSALASTRISSHKLRIAQIDHKEGGVYAASM
jgi:hypothetical protein